MADIIKESVYPFVTHGGIHDHQCFAPGITKREYYAALAMQAFISRLDGQPYGTEEMKFVAEYSTKQADALIAQEAKSDNSTNR